MTPRSEALAKARHLITARGVATLATVLTDGSPYTSLVLTANTPKGEPVLYVADIAEHTHNLLREPRASLLFEIASHEAEPMAHPRVGLVGRLAPSDDSELRQRFMLRHPSTDPQLGGFRVFLFQTDRARLVGGFGDVRWVEGAELFSPPL
jgi:heme iron utilization protein